MTDTSDNYAASEARLVKSQQAWEQHDKAFRDVSAYVVLDAQHVPVAKIAIKYPKDGAGRLWAYVHWIGTTVARHHSDGYGYDKRTPAVIGALLKADYAGDHPDIDRKAELERLKASLNPHSGIDWERQFRDAGYQVIQAV